MIQLHHTQPPLELNISLDDLFRAINDRHVALRYQKVHYSYHQCLKVNEPIGTQLALDTLVHYPALCKAIRKLPALDYEAEIPLHDIQVLNQKGLDAVITGLSELKARLLVEREKKSRLDAEVTNLIFLYGQDATMPVLHSFKPYYTLRRSYDRMNTRARKMTVSGVNYTLRYHGSRFGKQKTLYELTEYCLLKRYFDATKNDSDALSIHMRIELIGGFINTPIFAVRARNHYKQAGKKYYLDLNSNTTMTRLSEAQECARQYNKQLQLILLEKKL